MDIQTLFKKVEESDFTFEFSELIEVFSQPISTEIAEVESLIDLVLDIKYKLITEGDYSKVEAFVKTLETHQPNIINGAGKYFYHDLVEHFCATGDFKKAEDFFEPFIKDPLSDFDFYIMTFKKLLLYQRNTVLLRAIKQNYNAVRDSDRLVNGALRSFNHSLFSISTQEVYEKSDQNFDLDLLQEKLQPYDFDFSEDPIDAYNIGFYGEIPATEDLMIRFNADKDVMLLLLRNIFVKRMLNNGLQFSVSTLLFDLTRNYWDKKSNNKRKGNWKTYFKIKRKSFDDYLDELKGSFLAENYDIMFALTWGVAYVYDFLLEIKIIDSEHYAEFQEGYKQRIAEIMGSSLDGLYNRAYVMQWPKSEAVTQKEWEAQQSIFKKSLACQHDPSQDMIELIVDDIEAFGKYKMDILEAHEESLAFRNELEDMMHSYEDELFDDEIFDEFEDVDEEDYNIFDSDNDDFEDAEIINKNYIPSDTPFHAEAKPGRNEPCPCGSGKKYKKCCGKNG